MAGAVETQDQDVHNDGILSWYDRTRPMWIDLVGDYAGKELFLVEGDSLLRECFEDERIDFEGKYTPRYPSFLLRHPAWALNPWRTELDHLHPPPIHHSDVRVRSIWLQDGCY